MTTLEKAAKAMFEQVRARAKIAGLIFGPETQWEELPDWAQKEYTDQVRAALEALKGISFKILEHPTEKAFRCAGYDEALDFWNMTLDAILNEKA